MDENQVEKACHQISDMIFRYQLPPGSRISDFSLSKTLGISRTPVRQAILILLNQGLVVSSEKGFKVPEITLESIDELYDARVCLEIAVLRFAMRKGVGRDALARLRKEVELEEKCNNSGNIIDGLGHDFEFHNILNSLCQNQRLEKAISNLKLQTRMLNVLSLASPNMDTPRVYFSICDAIEAGDTEDACAKLTASIESGRQQKKNAMANFGIFGLQGIYNFIANSFKVSLRAD